MTNKPQKDAWSHSDKRNEKIKQDKILFYPIKLVMTWKLVISNVNKGGETGTLT